MINKKSLLKKALISAALITSIQSSYSFYDQATVEENMFEAGMLSATAVTIAMVASGPGAGSAILGSTLALHLTNDSQKYYQGIEEDVLSVATSDENIDTPEFLEFMEQMRQHDTLNELRFELRLPPVNTASMTNQEISLALLERANN